MKKTIPVLSKYLVLSALIALFFLSAASDASAQGYAGQVNRYSMTKFASTYTSIVGAGGTLVGGGDDSVFIQAINVPFAFSYDSTTYAAGAKFTASTNGFITLKGSYTAPSFDPAAGNMMTNQSTANANPLTLCIMHGDGVMDPGTSAGIYRLVSGVVGSRVLTVEFYNIYAYPAGGFTSFQIKLYEGTNIIEFKYKDKTVDYAPALGPCGIGIIGGTPTPVPTKTYSSSAVTTPDSNIRFKPLLEVPPNVQLSLSPKTINYGSVNVGSYSESTITAKHAGTVDTLTLNMPTITGPNASEFTIRSGPTPSGRLVVGASATYIVRYTPASGSSSSATFTLTSNGRDSGTQSVSLMGSGNAGPAVYPTIDVQPLPLVLFKNKRVSMSDGLEQFVVIRSTATDPLTITSYAFSGDAATSYYISRPPMNPIPGGTNDTLWIMFKPRAEGFDPAVLTINNNSTNNPAVQVQLKGIGTISRFVATPPSVLYDSLVGIGSSATRTLSIYNPGSDTLRITKQYFASNDVDFTYTALTGQDTAIAPLGTKTIPITFTPLQVGTRQARLRFLTRIPLTYQTPRQDTGFIEIEIRGNDVLYGSLTNLATIKDTVKVKTEICRTDTLWNTGYADVLVKAATLSGLNASVFTLNGLTLPVTLKPDEYLAYTICTTPKVVGTTKATVTFSGVTNNKTVTSATNYIIVGLASNSQIAPPILFNGISILKDTKRTETVSVTNTDSVITKYTTTVIKGEEYTIEADPVFLLWPGKSKTLAITFAPTSIGFKSGMLRISAANQADALIPMSGSGLEQASSVSQTEVDGYKLEQNYPNPTAGATNFSFSVPTTTDVRIIVADMTGNIIKEIANGRFDKGNHQISVSTKDLTSGAYLYILESNAVRLVRQMVVTK